MTSANLSDFLSHLPISPFPTNLHCKIRATTITSSAFWGPPLPTQCRRHMRKTTFSFHHGSLVRCSLPLRRYCCCAVSSPSAATVPNHRYCATVTTAATAMTPTTTMRSLPKMLLLFGVRTCSHSYYFREFEDLVTTEIGLTTFPRLRDSPLLPEVSHATYDFF